MNFSPLLPYWSVALSALGVTLTLAVTVCLTALLIAIALVCGKKSGNKFMQILISVYMKTFRSIPALVLLVWVFYALPVLTNIHFNAYISAWLALSINLSPFLADSLLSGISAIPKSQYESAMILGFSKFDIYWYIIFPQVFHNCSRDLISWFITEIKYTSLTSFIGIHELTHTANTVISNTFLPIEVYTALAAHYAVLIVAIEYLLTQLFKAQYKQVI